MNIKVTTYANNSKNSKVKGFASVNFNNEFVVNNITILEKNNGELYVNMPQRLTVQKNEETGLKERVHTSSFVPKNKQAAAELSSAVLDAFNSNRSKSYVLDSQMKLKGATAYYIHEDESPTKATLNLDFDDFRVTACYLQESKNGKKYVRQCATERSLPDKSGNFSKKYVDNFKPITVESANAVIESCVAAYEKEKNNFNSAELDLTQNNKIGKR